MLGGILSGSCRRMLLLAAPPALLIGSGPWPADFSSELSPQTACDWRVAERLFRLDSGRLELASAAQQKGSGQGKESPDLSVGGDSIGRSVQVLAPANGPAELALGQQGAATRLILLYLLRRLVLLELIR